MAQVHGRSRGVLEPLSDLDVDLLRRHVEVRVGATRSHCERFEGLGPQELETDALHLVQAGLDPLPTADVDDPEDASGSLGGLRDRGSLVEVDHDASEAPSYAVVAGA